MATVDWRQRRVRALIAEVPAENWQRRSAGAGAHGPRLCNWARIELLAGFDPAWARWLLARRSIPGPGAEPELAFYVSAGPAGTTLEQLVAVAGARWSLQECLQAANNESGLASYQVRDYTVSYRHITRVMLAHAWSRSPLRRFTSGAADRRRRR